MLYSLHADLLDLPIGLTSQSKVTCARF